MPRRVARPRQRGDRIGLFVAAHELPTPSSQDGTPRRATLLAVAPAYRGKHADLRENAFSPLPLNAATEAQGQPR
jgi:hypothetical protein